MSVLQKKKRLYSNLNRITVLRDSFNLGQWNCFDKREWRDILSYGNKRRVETRRVNKRYREIMRKAGKR